MNIQRIITRTPLCLLAWCTLAVAPTCAQTITHVPLSTFHGDSIVDKFALSVSGAGDVNGDGFSDLIVGTPDRDVSSGAYVGNARVLSGVDDSVLYNFAVTSYSDKGGLTVSGAGDVNGDGHADLIIGDAGAQGGRVRVLSGSDGSVLYSLTGDSIGDGFGKRSVSGAGDVNGDGFADLIVGAYQDDNNGSDSGSARVFSGSDGSVLHNFNGDSSDDLFGYSVSGAGDVNGDGFADLIVGAYRDDNNGTNSGSARVFSGIDGNVLFNLDGDSAGDQFGWSVDGAGDVNGDGFADLIVGAPSNDNNGPNSGSVRVFSGVDGSVLHNFNGDSPGDFFGWSVSDTGDINGDGIADLIVGTYRNDSNSGNARVFSGSDGSVLFNLDGDSAGEELGWSVSGAGDINGDGVADFVVSANRGGANDRGYAQVFVSQITVHELGDCNHDSVVNFLDIAPFISVLASASFLEQADCNQDDAVSFLDIAPFIAILAGN